MDSEELGKLTEQALEFKKKLEEAEKAERLEEDVIVEVVEELSHSVEKSPSIEACPQCGASMEASLSDSALTFPMVFMWSCTECSHTEEREDSHAEQRKTEMVDGRFFGCGEDF